MAMAEISLQFVMFGIDPLTLLLILRAGRPCTMDQLLNGHLIFRYVLLLPPVVPLGLTVLQALLEHAQHQRECVRN